MASIITTIFIFIQISGFLNGNNSSIPEYIGQMPEVMLTANNFETIPCGKTITGNFKVIEGDTVSEDVTVSGGNACIDGVLDGDLAVMGGIADANGLITGDVAVFGGNLYIGGNVGGDAAVFGGNIHNRGVIEGDLFVVGGTVSLDSGSVVEGDISMVGGSVDRDENAVVKGDIESIEIEKLNKVLPGIAKAFRFPRKFPGKRIFTSVLSISVLIVLYILNLLVLLIFPSAIDRIIDKIQSNVWVSVAIGIGLEILFIPLIILFAISLIGIPLIPVFILAIFIAGIFGFSGISLVIGDRISNAAGWHIKNRIGRFSLGWIVLMVVPILGLFLRGISVVGVVIPILGLVIVYIAATIGIGGVIYALVKREKKGEK